MEQNSHYKESLLNQIKEAYGKVVYTYTSHLKKIHSLEKYLKRIKYSQIVLSAISTGGFLGALITDENILTIIGGFFSTLLLAFNLFFKNFNMEGEIKQHMLASDELWLVRENYISLMTDFSILTDEEIIAQRNALLQKTYEIYKSTPKTDSKSYAKAQGALKKEEEQFFTNEELNQLLPSHLRSDKS